MAFIFSWLPLTTGPAAAVVAVAAAIAVAAPATFAAALQSLWMRTSWFAARAALLRAVTLAYSKERSQVLRLLSL